MGKLAINELRKINILLDTSASLDFNKGIKMEKLNVELSKEGSRFFLENHLRNKDNQRPPKVGQIIVGRKFWHYQTHIGVVTELTKNSFNYKDFTLSDSSQFIPLEWCEEIEQDKIDLINEDDEIYDFGKEYDNSFKLMIDGLKMAVEQLVP